MMTECLYCGKIILNKGSLASHTKVCASNPNRILRKRSENAGAKKGSIPWNKNKKGLQNAWNKGIIGSTTGKGITPEKEAERIRKIKETSKKTNGGFRRGSGRGKKGWYRGYWCDSSWELAFVVYNIEHNIIFERNYVGYDYIFENEIHKFYPDFIIDGIFYEIKGYMTPQNKEKIESFEHEIVLIDKKSIKKYIEYVVSKYGKNFIDLYGK